MGKRAFWLAAALASCAYCGQASATTFGSDVDASNTTGANNFHPALVGSPVTSGTAYVVFDNTPFSTGATDVLFSTTTNGGQSWTTPINMSNDGAANFPQIAVDALGNLYVVWSDNSAGHTQVYFTKSTNGGSTWSTPLNVSNDSGNTGRPHLTLDSSANIYLVWQDNSGLTTTDIFFAKSTNGGTSFTTPVNAAIRRRRHRRYRRSPCTTTPFRWCGRKR
jgi:hypothetical protein